MRRLWRPKMTPSVRRPSNKVSAENCSKYLDYFKIRHERIKTQQLIFKPSNLTLFFRVFSKCSANTFFCQKFFLADCLVSVRLGLFYSQRPPTHLRNSN